MKTFFPLFLFLAINIFANEGKFQKHHLAAFTENKGQVADQNNKSRNDVLYYGNASNMNYHLRKAGVSYELGKVNSWREISDQKTGKKFKIAANVSVYRVDMNWLNANTNFTVEKGECLPGYSNYYQVNCPNSVTNVRSYKNITYKNIYKGIDMKWYQNEGSLEYDFVVNPGADLRDIQIEVKGASIKKDKKGNIFLSTPFGTISECKPKVFQNGKLLKSNWVVNGDILSFNIPQYDIKLPLIIDPLVRTWGTYYGGPNDEYGGNVSSDASGNVYLNGASSSSLVSTIATSGSHQNTQAGSFDGFVVKFDANGVRQWATYYGGANSDGASFVSVDGTGNVYLVGSSSSTLANTAIATASSHQPGFGGGAQDGYIVKFNSSGVRQWGTFYGGSGSDGFTSCVTDASGNLYAAGYTNSSGGTVIATAASHQSAFGTGAYDGFIVKFSSGGVRQWASYYGGTGDDYIYSSGLDANGDFIFAGQTNSGNGTSIATAGSHQSAFGGDIDGFLAKFDPSGVRQWATYYGGGGPDPAYTCTSDLSSNVYLAGISSSTAAGVIATPGSFMPNWSGFGDDAFLVKFNSAGVRQWGTFYGGSGTDQFYGSGTDASGNIIVGGLTDTPSGTAIATSGQHQSVYGGGGGDGFFVKFNSSGSRIWGTYYGGSGYDYLNNLNVHQSGVIYIAGDEDGTATGTVIATGNGHQSSFGGGPGDTFLAQFTDCQPFTINITGKNLICLNKTNTLSATGANTYTWMPGSLTGNTINATPSVSTVYTITGSVANSCTSSATFSVTLVTPQTPDICMVSVDSLSNYNEIYWEKSLYTNVDSFIVYRETSTNVYKRIASISKNAFSGFVDTAQSIGPANGNPNTTYYRYKLQLRDTCGNYSALSKWHETIFIQDQQNGNFNWNPYAIETSTNPVTVYDLYRVNLTNTSYTLVTSTTGQLATDPQYNTWQTTAKWRVMANGFNCNPTLMKSPNELLSQKVKTRSNIKNDRLIGISEHNLMNNAIKLYPSPAKEIIHFEASVLNNASFEIELQNILGQIVYSKKYSLSNINNVSIDVREFKSGVYFVNFKQEDKTVATKKVVVVK